MQTTSTPTRTIVGTVTVLEDVEDRQGYETAAWHQTYKIPAGQTVDLVATRAPSWPSYQRGRFVFVAKARGVCVSSYFASLYGGVPISRDGRGVDEHVGEEAQRAVFHGDEYGLAVALRAQDGFVWYAAQHDRKIRVDVDPEALAALGLDMAAVTAEEWDRSKRLHVADVTRQDEALQRLAQINAEDRERLQLVRAGEPVPARLMRSRHAWDEDAALRQWEHTLEGLGSGRRRLHELRELVARQYGVTVPAARTEG